MKVALYARVSKDEKYTDNRYQEPENQLIPLRNWAKAKEWDIAKEYVDRASGADASRPEFRLMLEEAYISNFQAILVWKMDRFSRENMSAQLSYIRQLKTRGIGLISLTESWLDTRAENPISEVILAIMAWAAAEERRKISERTKAGIQRLRNIGQWKGGRPKKRGVAVSDS